MRVSEYLNKNLYYLMDPFVSKNILNLFTTDEETDLKNKYKFSQFQYTGYMNDFSKIDTTQEIIITPTENFYNFIYDPINLNLTFKNFFTFTGNNGVYNVSSVIYNKGQNSASDSIYFNAQFCIGDKFLIFSGYSSSDSYKFYLDKSYAPDNQIIMFLLLIIL